MNPVSNNAPVALPLMDEVARQTYPAGTLYVLATPIGNFADITLRALHTLTLVDAVACEDTRNTGHLLAHYGLSKNMIAAHQHNEREIAEKLIVRLQAGERIALVSDAGTPAVSDPGARIVDAVRSAGLRVLPLPGPSAAVTALSASGLVCDQFHFVGFLPAKARQRELALQQLRATQATLIFKNTHCSIFWAGNFKIGSEARAAREKSLFLHISGAHDAHHPVPPEPSSTSIRTGKHQVWRDLAVGSLAVGLRQPAQNGCAGRRRQERCCEDGTGEAGGSDAAGGRFRSRRLLQGRWSGR